jgi:hypothetical protein
VPLLVAGGLSRPPLAVSIAAGVSGATLLALYFVPSVWIVMRKQAGAKAPLRAEAGSAARETGLLGAPVAR